MKLKKIIAAVAAAAVAVSTMAFSAFAIKDYPDGYVLDLIAEGYDVTAVAGFTIKISGDIDSGTGGGAGFNSKTTGWDQTDWANADAGKTINASGGEITVKRDAPVFKESDVTDPTNPYAQIWMQQWWGPDVTIESVTVLDKDGNVLTSATAPAAEEEAAPAEEEEAAAPAEEEEEAAPVEDEAEAEDEDIDADEPEDIEADESDEEEAAPVAETEAPVVEEAPAPAVENATAAPATGNTAVATVVAVMAVAGAAAIVSKKRK